MTRDHGGAAPHPSLSVYVPRNFDDVISCFANVAEDTPLFSKAQTSMYCEEDSKVSV